ncbi:MAG: ParB/RepB/Spo0J family partition protein, partial [Bdellovibrionota bacterium]
MSEELIPARKGGRQSLGRGLGSLLGETGAAAKMSDASTSVATSRTNPILPSKSAATTAPQQHTKSSAAPAQAKTIASATTSTTPTVAPAPQLKPEQRIWQLPIEKIVPNKEQPRRTFTPELLKELADSIKEKGVIQPILVRPIDGGQKYEIIAGERRWRASQQAGLREVPAIMKSIDSQETLELALIENIQRADLNPIEEAEAYAHLTKTYALTQQEIAQKMGKDRVTIANLMRLLNLHPEVRDMVKRSELQMGQAKVLLSVDSQDDQLRLAKKVVKQGLTVRAVERLIKKVKDGEEDELSIYNEKEEITRKMLKEIEIELQKKIGTRVAIQQTAG